MTRLERLLLLHRWLASDRQPTIDDLASHLELSHFSVFQEIRWLKLYLDAPIVCEAGRYRYARPYSLDEAARRLPWPS